MKRLFSFVLALILVFSMIPSVFAAEDKPGIDYDDISVQDFTYTVVNGEATITGYIGAGGDIAIPDCIGDYPVTAIGEEAFLDNETLTGVAIPGTVKAIEDDAFFTCSNLKEIYMQEGVQEIGSYAFFACEELTSVVIPDSVTKIETGAFSFCSNLESVTLGKGLQTLEDCALAETAKLKEIQVDADNASFCDVDGILFNKDKTVLVQYPAGVPGSYTVPDGVTTIGSGAFCWSDVLTSVTLPDSVKTIGSGAFRYSVIEHIDLGQGVEVIGFTAFEGCGWLKEITIPDSTTQIGSMAFANSLLQTVRLGLGIKTIGYDAFQWCVLNAVRYKGTKAQWDAIEIDAPNNDLLAAKIICEADHVHSYVRKVTEPTCTERGYTTYTCECGESYKDDYTKAKGHTYSKGECTACGHKPDGVKITTQPTNAVVASGKTAKVTVKATGTGLKYTWYYAKKGSSKFTKTTVTSSSYSVKMSSSVNGGKVYCQITDKYGNTVKSNTVTLYKGTPAKITTQPNSVTVVGGKTGKLELKASGSSLTYTWYIKYKSASSFAKVGKSSKTYSFKMASKLDGAQVYCVVKDKYGITVKSSVVTVKLAPVPKITAQPKSAAIANGSTAKFTVKATGDGLKYQWYYAKKGSSSFKKLSGKTAATYSVKMSSSVNGYKYYCLVTDKYGQTVKSTAVTLSLKTVAKITAQPKSVTVVGGKTANLTVKAVGDGAKYTWYYLKKGETEYAKSSVTTDTMSVKMSSAWDGAKVYCVVADKYGNTVKSSVVTIKQAPKPEITTQPKSVLQVSGKTVKFTVNASGDGLKYQWYYAKKGSNSFKKLSGKTSATYSVKVSSSVNGCKYYCLVTDQYGQTVKSSAATLTLKTVAKITTQPKSVTVTSGKTAKFTAKAVGDGVDYVWFVRWPDSDWEILTWSTNTISFKTTKDMNGLLFMCCAVDKYENVAMSKEVKLKVK